MKKKKKQRKKEKSKRDSHFFHFFSCPFSFSHFRPFFQFFLISFHLFLFFLMCFHVPLFFLILFHFLLFFLMFFHFVLFFSLEKTITKLDLLQFDTLFSFAEQWQQQQHQQLQLQGGDISVVQCTECSVVNMTSVVQSIVNNQYQVVPGTRRG